MAKWGEGDPRWIVEERPDATNVNNWHWTEKNAGPWSQERLKELFKNVPVPTADATLHITELEKCEGEASASNRKGKLIFFYEWEVTLTWKGKLKNGTDMEHTGSIKIPNLSEENDVTDLDIQISLKDADEEGDKLKQIMYQNGKQIQISLKDADEEGDKLKQIMYQNGKQVVRDQVSKYLSSLKEEFSKGMILPKKDEVKPDNIKTLTSGFNRKINMAPVVNHTNNSVGLKIDTTAIKSVQKFQCTAQEIYDALTRPELITAFTRGHVKCDSFKGGQFQLFGGNIIGKFEELVAPNKIVQQWRLKQWPDGHYSIVTLKLDQKEDHTEVSLSQSGVPTSEADVTRENWQRYYWDAIKQTFGFGAFL